MTGLWTPDGDGAVSAASDHAADDTEFDLDDIDPEEARRLAAEMAEVRAKLATVPAAQVVANHAMGLFELAAIHLQQEHPLFSEAALAIDAMGAIVEGVGADRLGDVGQTLTEALQQIRLAFVQIKASHAA
ncbi:MAG: hypothetical protein AB7V43_20215 [Acidimicrobiia bacterium]